MFVLHALDLRSSFVYGFLIVVLVLVLVVVVVVVLLKGQTASSPDQGGCLDHGSFGLGGWGGAGFYITVVVIVAVVVV